MFHENKIKMVRKGWKKQKENPAPGKVRDEKQMKEKGQEKVRRDRLGF